MGFTGVLEGFYGRPWTTDERILVSQFCAARGMTHYVYAPKDDPKQRHEWREPYTTQELEEFRRLAVEGGIGLGCSVSPGLSIDYRSGEDRALLMAKIESMVDAGASLISLQFDDIPNRPGLGEEHGDITAWVHGHLAGRAELTMCPTEYVGVEPSPYLSALADLVPEEVPIQWTGRCVVNDTISVADAQARAAAIGGRRPSLWDNYPVNDAVMGDQLFMGPLRGREPGLVEACDGYLANALVQPKAGLLPLASVAAFLRGEDPRQAWEREADDLGLRIFAEACDGDVPYALATALAEERGGIGWAAAAASLAAWLRLARECVAPGIEDEVGPWLAAVHEEAGVALEALRALQDARPVARIAADGSGRAVAPVEGDAFRHLFAALVRWKAARRSEVSVLGPRLGLRVVFGQSSTGEFNLRPGTVTEDRSATDVVVRAALAEVETMDAPSPLQVLADGEQVAVSDDGSFRVPAGATVVVRSGRAATRVEVPCEPPLPERRLS